MGCCGGPREACDFDDDVEGLSAADLERFGHSEIVCRGCGEDLYVDAAMCPSCGQMVLDRSDERGRGGFVYVVVVIAVVAAALGVVLW